MMHNPSSSNVSEIHATPSQRSPYQQYLHDEQMHLYNAGILPSSATPFASIAISPTAPSYPYGGPPPDMVRRDAPNQGDVASGLTDRRANHQVQMQPPAPGGYNPPSNVMVPQASNLYRPPHFHQRAMQQQTVGAFYGYQDPGQSPYWVGPPRSLYGGGETRNEAPVSSACIDERTA